MERQSRERRSCDDEVANLLLFPEEICPPAELSPTTRASVQPESPSPWNSPFSLMHITAEWPALLQRLGRRRRVLETILTAGRPVKLIGATLIIGFPPYHRFHKELLDMPDYRTGVEDELSRTFQVRLTVATSFHPETRHLPHHGRLGNTPA